jgi:hypothetical protein
MAGLADGGDLLFHEACQRLGVPTQVLLPVPERVYRATAMSRQASRWADRYYAALRNATKVLTLARTDMLPGWLQTRPGYSTWQRDNQWILHQAWATTTSDRVTVLALWNGEPGDGPGGVADMVATAQARGAEVVTLDTVALFGLPSPELPPPHPPAEPPTGTHADPPAEATARTNTEAERGVAPAPSPATEAAGGDRVLDLVWRCHRQWSQAAAAAQSQLKQWRQRNLALLVLGALAGALAAQHGLSSGFVTAAAAVSAVALAVAAWLQRTAFTSDETAHWTGARAASEALKAEVYRYLSKVKPYDGAERTERLNAQLEVIQTRGRAWLVDQQLIPPDNRPLPPVSTFAGYLTERAQEQANWHRNKIAEHVRKARTLRICQLAATGAGVVLAAVAGVLPGSHLAAWTAAATTIAAAFATHLAAEQHQRIAASYASTADQLDRLIADVDPASADPDRQAQFVLDVEQALAAQNSGWMDLLSPHAPSTPRPSAPRPSAPWPGQAPASAAR